VWMNLLRSGHLSDEVRKKLETKWQPSPPLATPSPLLGLSLSARLGAGAVWRRPEW